MTDTEEAYRGSAEILAIGQLVLHRETLRELTDNGGAREAERAGTKGKGCGGDSSASSGWYTWSPCSSIY